VSDCHSDWPAPDAIVVYDESGQKVVVFARRNSVTDSDPDNFVTSTDSPVPRAVKSGKDVPVIFQRKSRHTVGGGVKDHLERGRVRLQEDIRNDRLAGEIRTLAHMAGILMVPQVIPRPSVKFPFF
jgi:hypothetical protein